MAVYAPGHPFPSSRPAEVLAARLAGTSLLAGVIGGAITTYLFLAMLEAHGSAPRTVINIATAVSLLGLIAWRLLSPTRAPSAKVFVGLVAAGVALILATAALVEIFQFGGNFDAEQLAVMGFVAIYGAIIGLVPAVVCLLVLSISLAMARRMGLGVTFAVTERMTTVLAMVVTAAFALWLAQAFGNGFRIRHLPMAAMIAVVAGTGANLAIRWSLVEPKA